MHVTKSSILFFILLVIIGADAVTVFRGGNASGPASKIRAGDFDIVDGQVVPNAKKGLSCFTTLAAAKAAIKAKDFYSIDSGAIEAAGFGFLEDGKDIPGGTKSEGHRSITVKTAVSEATLQQGLNNINDAPGPGVLKWTKLARTAAPAPAAKPAAAPAAAKPPAAKPAAPAAKPAKLAKPAAPAAKPAVPAIAKPPAPPVVKSAVAPKAAKPVAKTKHPLTRSRSRVFRGVEVAA